MGKILRPRHDQLFRKAMELPQVAQEFFGRYLPDSISGIIDRSSIKLVNGSFIEPELKDSISDILFSAQFNNNDGYIYLLTEHQSKPSHFMAFRLFRYMINIASRHIEKNKGAKHLPLIYPLVFYNGKLKYNAPLNIWELFENSALARDIWTNDYQLVNIQEIPDEEFKQSTWSGIMEFFLKNARHRDLLEKLDVIGESMPRLTKLTVGLDYLELMLTYSLTAIDKTDKMKLENKLKTYLDKKSEEKVMTSLAQHWWQEGRVEGKMEGKMEGIEIGIGQGITQGIGQGIEIGLEKTAINMLRQGLDINFISECTSLPVDIIQVLRY